MTKKMKYDFLNGPLDIIESIEQRSCLWDKTADDYYKDRMKKNNAWQEVYRFIIDDYETFGEKDKLNSGKILQFFYWKCSFIETYAYISYILSICQCIDPSRFLK